MTPGISGFHSNKHQDLICQLLRIPPKRCYCINNNWDEVGGAIVLEEKGDFLTQLARDMLKGAKLFDLQTLFADDLQVSHNPMGSLTTPSAVIVPGPKVMTWDDWISQKTVVVRRIRRKEVIPEGQLGFGI